MAVTEILSGQSTQRHVLNLVVTGDDGVAEQSGYDEDEEGNSDEHGDDAPIDPFGTQAQHGHRARSAMTSPLVINPPRRVLRLRTGNCTAGSPDHQATEDAVRALGFGRR
jgi:hypothetical protein